MADGRRFARWWFVAVAAVAMGTIGVYQFGWSSIRGPLAGRVGADEPALGTIFTLFVVFQTVSQFPAGWVRDRYGPRVPLLVGAGLLAVGFAATGVAESVTAAAAAYALGGVGAGAVYTVAVNTPVKWFDERRGLATGVVTMSYSGLSFLLIPLVRRGTAGRFRGTLLALGAAAGLTALVAAVVLRDPDRTAGGEPDVEENSDEGFPKFATDGDAVAATPTTYTWRETVRTWQFWLLYGVFVVVNGVGLMVVGKVVSFASAHELGAAAATASASAVALADAGGVAVGGWLSDVLGRRRTVAGSLVLCGVSLAGAVLAAEAGLGVGFLALVAAAAFFRSPPFAVFPGIVGDYYGRAHSSENYAVLYSAKLWGGVGGGVAASALVVAVGWSRAFALGAVLVILAGLATTSLRPVE
ncbi:oxalate:formate antiporter [Halobacteriales archaeon QS_1_68_20]|nr:MAG: oxalate:formate antiporter [Halobacteriales archaeon QS_1_68_20]